MLWHIKIEESWSLTKSDQPDYSVQPWSPFGLTSLAQLAVLEHTGRNSKVFSLQSGHRNSLWWYFLSCLIIINPNVVPMRFSFVYLYVFLKKLDSAGPCTDGGETRALHLQPPTCTPVLAARKAAIFFCNEILLLLHITEIVWRVVPWILTPQTLLKASVREYLH